MSLGDGAFQADDRMYNDTTNMYHTRRILSSGERASSAGVERASLHRPQLVALIPDVKVYT